MDSCTTSATLEGYAEEVTRHCDKLPFTGSEPVMIALAGLGLILVAATLFYMARLMENDFVR